MVVVWMHIGMLLPSYELSWQRFVFAQAQSCNIERTEALAYLDGSPGMIGAHEGISSCCFYPRRQSRHHSVNARLASK